MLNILNMFSQNTSALLLVFSCLAVGLLRSAAAATPQLLKTVCPCSSLSIGNSAQYCKTYTDSKTFDNCESFIYCTDNGNAVASVAGSSVNVSISSGNYEAVCVTPGMNTTTTTSTTPATAIAAGALCAAVLSLALA